MKMQIMGFGAGQAYVPVTRNGLSMEQVIDDFVRDNPKCETITIRIFREGDVWPASETFL